MTRSAHNPPETSTRFIGWCPICQRNIKVRTGLLVHYRSVWTATK